MVIAPAVIMADMSVITMMTMKIMKSERPGETGNISQMIRLRIITHTMLRLLMQQTWATRMQWMRCTVSLGKGSGKILIFRDFFPDFNVFVI